MDSVMNSTSELKTDSKASLTVAWIGYLLLSVFGVLANALTIVAVRHNPVGLNTHYKLITNLSVSDMLLDMVVISAAISKSIFDSQVGIKLKFLCYYPLTTLSVFTNLGTVMALSADHYCAILKPLQYRKYFSVHGNKYIAVIWLLTFSIVLIVYIIAAILLTVTNSTNYINCVERMYIMYGGGLIPSFVILCVVALICVYIRIGKELQNRTEYGIKGSNSTSETCSQRTVITTILIGGSFVICWLPGWTCEFLGLLAMTKSNLFTGELTNSYTQIRMLTSFLHLVNTIIDPIVYSIRDRNVQKGYRKTWNKLLKRFNSESNRANNNESFLSFTENEFEMTRRGIKTNTDVTT